MLGGNILSKVYLDIFPPPLGASLVLVMMMGLSLLLMKMVCSFSVVGPTPTQLRNLPS